VAMQHQFRFAHTNVFWLVPLVMVTFWQHYCGEEGNICNLYLSGSSKMMLVLTSLVNSTMAWTAERNSRARFLAARSVQLTRDAYFGTWLVFLHFPDSLELISCQKPAHNRHLYFSNAGVEKSCSFGRREACSPHCRALRQI